MYEKLDVYKMKDLVIISLHKGFSTFFTPELASSLDIIYTKLFKNIPDTYWKCKCMMFLNRDLISTNNHSYLTLELG